MGRDEHGHGQHRPRPRAQVLRDQEVWNGALIYDLCSVGALAGYGHLDNGCTGALGVPALTALSPPTLGGALTVEVTGLPSDIAIMMLGLSRTTSPLGPLPFDLTPLGAQGCRVLVSPDANTLLLGAGGVATYSQSIPSNPTLLCTPIYNQAFVFDAAANALGSVVSDAAAGVLGG